MANTKAIRKRNKSLGTSLEMSQFINAGSNKIKKRIRDIERLLLKKRDTLPHTVIVEKERVLEALKLELQNAQDKNVIKKNAKKYHMVRFFEKKKALRKYNQTLKKVENGDATDADLLKAKINVCYVVNFPKTERYIALYPNTDNGDSNTENSKETTEKTEIRRNAFLKLVKENLEDGTLPVSFDEILKGKKLAKENIGVAFNNKSSDKEKASAGESEEESEQEEEDDFFE